MKNLKEFYGELTLTSDQNQAVDQLQIFLNSTEKVFLLKGYAGTGKTTLIKGIIEYLASKNRTTSLMAPTGRAAKVIEDKTESAASTIHRAIYCFDELVEIENKTDKENDGYSLHYEFKLRLDPGNIVPVIIVDEASMISNQYSEGEFFRFGSGMLLNDLIAFSRIRESQLNSQIIFVGDPAQLPPVGMNFSPALSEEYLEDKIGLKIQYAELKEVKRQSEGNGILTAASRIRKSLTSGFYNDFNVSDNGKDLFEIQPGRLVSTFLSMKGTKQIIAFKNNTAKKLNEEIRFAKFGETKIPQPGDIMISGKNNYKAGILNGEFAIVISASKETIIREVKFRRKGGKTVSVNLEWRKIELMADDKMIIDGYSLENYLHGEAYIKGDEFRGLYVDFKNRHPHLKKGKEEFQLAIKNDPYFNCLLLKYGYAVTCHKAQGGEWNETIVIWDKGAAGINQNGNSHSGRSNSDFYRWAYTAVTRASKKMYSFDPPCFSIYSSMKIIDAKIQNSFKQISNETLVVEEIDFNDELKNLITNFNLDDAPLNIQDHLIKIWYNLKETNIEIIKWEKKEYEIRYFFRRENEKCALKFWIDGKNVFKSKFMEFPPGTDSKSLFEELSQIIKSTKSLIINRKEKIRDDIVIKFDIDLEESKPFLKILFDDLMRECKHRDIHISSVEHFNYRERYTFSRGSENVRLDFEYDDNGSFGRAVFLKVQNNSIHLSNEISLILSILTNNVI